uniref:adenylyl-sulfate kinase n=1 Tax=Streptomyces sp. ODS05-4 TaxID=2944939 RepID=UPI00210E0E30
MEATHAPPSEGRGGTVWLTGLPSAGKSTLARAIAARLRADDAEEAEDRRVE